jgi:hypothetical protein
MFSWLGTPALVIAMIISLMGALPVHDTDTGVQNSVTGFVRYS